MLVVAIPSTTITPEVTPNCTFAITDLVVMSSEQTRMRRDIHLAAHMDLLILENIPDFAVSVLNIDIYLQIINC